MAWFGRVCNQLRTLSIEDIPIEEAFQYIEDKLATVGQTIRLMCSDDVEDVISAVMLDSDSGNNLTSQKTIITKEEEGLIICDVLDYSSYVSSVDKVQSTTKDSDIKMYEDSNAGVNADIPTVIVAESADNNKFPNMEGSSITGLSDIDTYSGMRNRGISEEWLVCALRHRNAVGAYDCLEKNLETHMQEAVSRPKVVSEKMGDGLNADPESTTLNDEWQII